MATTGNKNYLLQANGSNAGTWGDKLNDEVITYLDTNLGGVLTKSVSAAGTFTLSASEARNANVVLTGNPATSVLVYTYPAGAGNNQYGYLVVENKCSTSVDVRIGNLATYNAGDPTTYAVIPKDVKAVLFSDATYGVRIIAQTYTNMVTTFSAGSTGLTPSTGTSGAVTLAGTLGIANGGTGLTTLTANNVILGNGTSAPQFVAPSTSGNFLTSNGTTWTSATYVPINYGTITATTSGTEVNFSNVIPSTAKRIQVLLNDVSLSGNENILIQLGYSSPATYQTTGYYAACWRSGGSSDTSTAGFIVTTYTNSNYRFTGIVSLVRFSASSSFWLEEGQLQDRDGTAIGNVGTIPQFSCGNVTLSGSITSLRLKSTGTNTFDLGSANITWES